MHSHQYWHPSQSSGASPSQAVQTPVGRLAWSTVVPPASSSEWSYLSSRFPPYISSSHSTFYLASSISCFMS
jgi:hypothetical protein